MNEVPWGAPGNPCCCCPTPMVKGETVSASKFKCGYSKFGEPEVIYAVATENYAINDVYETGTVACPDRQRWTSEGSRTTQLKYASRTSPCVNDSECSGSIEHTFTQKDAECAVIDSCSNTATYSYSFTPPNVGCIASESDPSCGGTGGAGETEWVYTGVITAAELIAATEASLPPWPGTWSGGGLGAFRNLSPDEFSYSARKERYVVYVASALPSGKKLVASYERTFFPEGGGSPVVTGGTVEIGPGATESAPVELGVPAADGTETFAVVSYECQNI